MVAERSGVQFGVKSYAWFQNQTSAQYSFDLKLQVWLFPSFIFLQIIYLL